MREFKINENLNVVCEHENTRSGFRHTAVLLRNGIKQLKVKVCYQNRTWERYEFQTVMSKLKDKIDLTEEENKQFLEMIANPDRVKETLQPLKQVGSVMALGEIFCNSQKDKNDWKLRMLKAGTESKGLIMPEDWDSLTEEIKAERLSKLEEHLSKIGA